MAALDSLRYVKEAFQGLQGSAEAIQRAEPMLMGEGSDDQSPFEATRRMSSTSSPERSRQKVTVSA